MTTYRNLYARCRFGLPLRDWHIGEVTTFYTYPEHTPFKTAAMALSVSKTSSTLLAVSNPYCREGRPCSRATMCQSSCRITRPVSMPRYASTRKRTRFCPVRRTKMPSGDKYCFLYQIVLKNYFKHYQVPFQFFEGH